MLVFSHWPVPSTAGENCTGCGRLACSLNVVSETTGRLKMTVTIASAATSCAPLLGMVCATARLPIVFTVKASGRASAMPLALLASVLSST